MKRFLKVAVPIVLAIVIVLCIGWYFFQYNTAVTRDLLLQQARRQELAGKHDSAVWFYNLAYDLCDDNDRVAIELSQQFKAIGNYSKAEYTLSKAIERNPTTQLYIALSKLYVEQDKLLDAVRLLDYISDPALRAELDDLRPAMPTCETPSGTYAHYFSAQISAPGGTLYVSTDSDYPSVQTDLYTAPLAMTDGQNTLFALCVDESGLVSPLAVFTYRIEGVVEPITFVDPAVEEAVRTLLGVDTGYTVYSNELWALTEFTVPAEALSCADLSWMPNLQRLTIIGDYTSLEALAKLTSLHSLSIQNGSVSVKDLRIIAALPQLQELRLVGCGLSNITPLAETKNLVYLDLSENAIRDISPLGNLTTLETLILHSNALIHLEDLGALNGLKELDASYNYLSTTAHVSTLTGLTKLDVSANGLMKLEGVDTLVNLQHLAASYNNFVEVDILAACPQLETLDVSHNTLLQIDVTAKLTNLKELDFSHNEVSLLPKFTKDCSLETINGSYNDLASVVRLSKLSNLVYIYMDYNAALSDVSSLQHCPALREVHVYGTKVRSVSVLTKKGIFVNYTPV